MSGLRAPNTVDFNINGICNLDCKWCWGPVHDAKEDVNLSEWKHLAYIAPIFKFFIKMLS